MAAQTASTIRSFIRIFHELVNGTVNSPMTPMFLSGVGTDPD
jgi:hypothetical protein